MTKNTTPKAGARVDTDPIRTDTRRARRQRRFPIDAACVLCLEQTPEALWLGGSTLIEAHHVAGRQNDAKLIAPLCLNCHRKATEGQRVAGVDLARNPHRNEIRTLASWLAAIGDFFALLAASAHRLAEVVRRLVGYLDEQHPDWESEHDIYENKENVE